MQTFLELEIDELNTRKKMIVETFVKFKRRPETEVATIMAFADEDLGDKLDTLCSDILDFSEQILQGSSITLKSLYSLVKSNNELVESVLIYRTGGVPLQENDEQIRLCTLLNTVNLESVIILITRIDSFLNSRKSEKRALGNESFYNVVSTGKFELADYLLNLDPDCKSTLKDLQLRDGFVEDMFETFNLPLFRWYLTKKPNLRVGISELTSCIQWFEYSKNLLPYNYEGDELQQKSDDADEFKNLIFEDLGYDLKAVKGDQLQCLECSPEAKEEITYLAKIVNANIITTFECVIGRSPNLLKVITDKQLNNLLVYFTKPQDPPIVKRNAFFSRQIADNDCLKTFSEQIPFFNKQEQLNFRSEIKQIVLRNKLNGQNLSIRDMLVVLQHRTEVSERFHFLDGDKARENLNSWRQILMTHLQNGEVHVLQYLFFNAISKNKIETVKIVAQAMEKSGWHLDKTNEKLVQSLNILKNSEHGETAAWKMFCALRPVLTTEEAELVELPRFGQ